MTRDKPDLTRFARPMPWSLAERLERRVERLERELETLRVYIGAVPPEQPITDTEVDWRERKSPSDFLVSSVTIATAGAHEVISIWVRGALAGELTVSGEDALRIALRLADEFRLEVDNESGRRFVAKGLTL